MNSRQRILDALAHRQPDRVPVDLGSTPSSGISAIAYGRLRRHLGLTSGHVRVYDVVQQLAQPEDAVLDRFGVDAVNLGCTFNTDDRDWYDIRLPDGAAGQYPAWFHPVTTPGGDAVVSADDGTEIARMVAGATYFDQSCYPFADGYPADLRQLPQAMAKVQWAALPRSPWDNAARPDYWQRLRSNALALRQRTDRAVVLSPGCNLFEWGCFLRRMDNFLMDLVEDPDQVEKLLDVLLERHLQTLAKVCQAVGDVVDLCRFGDDLGMDTGPFMAPQTYRRLFKPRHQMLCDYVKRHSSMHTYLHCCGSIHALIPDLIDAGFEVLNPVQTTCHRMEPDRLKKDFGRDVTFWGGGCDTRSVLNRATPAQVKDHVKRRLEIFATGGGFVFNTVHNIMPDVPPENIVAMFEAVREFGK